MISVQGRDGEEGFRFFFPRRRAVVDGRIKVFTVPSLKITAWMALFNVLVALGVFYCRMQDKGGRYAPLHAWIYVVALAVLLAELVLKLGWLWPRRRLAVYTPLELGPIPGWLWGEHAVYWSALTSALVAAIERAYPLWRWPWEGLMWVCVAMMWLPFFNLILVWRRTPR